MQQKHFDFLQHCGWYHHITSDFPKISVSLAYLFLTEKSKICHSDPDKSATVLLLVCSVLSLLLGIIKQVLVRLLTDGSGGGGTGDGRTLDHISEAKKQQLEYALHAYGRDNPIYARLAASAAPPQLLPS